MAKVLFIQKAQYLLKENLGIMQLSAVLKQNGHEVDVLLIGTNGYPAPVKEHSRLVQSIRSVFSLVKEYMVMVGSQNSTRNQLLTDKKIIEYVKNFNPDIIGFSVMTIDSEWVLKISTLSLLQNS